MTDTENSTVQFGVWFQPTTTPTTVARWARLAEDSGFDFIGITDGQNIWRDAYVCLTAAALATQRIRLGPWVTNAFTRHVTVTANSIATLNEMTGGRAFLGIGIGDDSVKTLGHRVARLEELAGVVEQLRRLWRGEAVEASGARWTLATPGGAPELYWACANERSLQWAGRVADGAIISAWLVPELMAMVVKAVNTGATAAGRAPGAVAKIFNTCVSISEDGAVARAAARPYVARALCYTSSALVPGWSEADRERFRARYNYYDHFAPEQGLAREVPEDLISKKAVAGTPEECAELLQLVVDRGFGKIALIVMGDVESNVRLLANRVIPKLRRSSRRD